ncbi:MAG: hypothetical protein OEV44_01440 [Spirochaetota bacterium]|nr:hypothetical protein [Spirochaetota bacterium]
MKTVKITYQKTNSIKKCPVCDKDHVHREEIEESPDSRTIVTHYYEGLEILGIHDPAFAKDVMPEADLKVVTSAYVFFLKH